MPAPCTGYEARNLVSRILDACPHGQPAPDCPLTAIRAWPMEHRNLWLLSEDDEAIEALCHHHQRCHARRLAAR